MNNQKILEKKKIEKTLRELAESEKEMRAGRGKLLWSLKDLRGKDSEEDLEVLSSKSYMQKKARARKSKRVIRQKRQG